MQLSFSRNNFLFLMLALLLSACANNNDANSGPSSTTPVTPAVPLQNTTAGVDHYTCPNGHPGAASGGNCSVCGVALEHNQAYHDNQATTTPEITTTPTTPDATTPSASPAQNAAGEYHYTCPNGHPGAASGGSCAVCGSALAHNQAYHNTPGAVAPTTSTPSITPAAGNGPTFAPMLQENAGTPAARVPQTTTTAATPAKNARGEYHYTCPNGHAGAGAAGSCSVCGSTLAHNAAYHN
ncbi:MAG: hypothetical protein KTR30_11430 [Saprospiraceae bacterium]|nr:hypothetical protein [Saprospiraceae bacterium]